MANTRMGNGGGEKKLRLSMNDDEIYVCVSKTFGGGMFQVIDNDGKEYNAILRGKMKGPNKRHNFVSLFSILLVGLRSDLSDSSVCDILFVFDDHDILSLSLLPNFKFNNLIHFHHNHSFLSSSSSASASSSDYNSNDPFLSSNLGNSSTILQQEEKEEDSRRDVDDLDFNDI